MPARNSNNYARCCGEDLLPEQLTHKLWMDVVSCVEGNMQSARRVLPKRIDAEIQNLSTLNRKFDSRNCSSVCVCITQRISLSCSEMAETSACGYRLEWLRNSSRARIRTCRVCHIVIVFIRTKHSSDRKLIGSYCATSTTHVQEGR